MCETTENVIIIALLYTCVFTAAVVEYEKMTCNDARTRVKSPTVIVTSRIFHTNAPKFSLSSAAVRITYVRPLVNSHPSFAQLSTETECAALYRSGFIIYLFIFSIHTYI